MRIAIVYEPRAGHPEVGALYAPEESIEFLSQRISRMGHVALRVPASGGICALVQDLTKVRPDLIYNLSFGAGGATRQAMQACIYEEVGIPYTGSGPASLALAQDKHLTKVVAAAAGIITPRWQFIRSLSDFDAAHMQRPVIIKPNFEGASIGITRESIVPDGEAAVHAIARLLSSHPDGVIIEEFVPGMDVSVSFLEAVDNEYGGVLIPSAVRYPHGDDKNILDFDFKSGNVRCSQSRPILLVPAELPDMLLRRLRSATRALIARLGCRDVARADYRVTPAGEIQLLEVNSIPAIEPEGSLDRSAVYAGLPPDLGATEPIIRSAASRFAIDQSSPVGD